MIRVLFMLGLALADELDRTYLPPPDSKFSDGGINSLPFEQPKSVFLVSDEYLTPFKTATGVPGNPTGLQDTYVDLNTSLINDPASHSKSVYTTRYSLPQTTTISQVKDSTENGIVLDDSTNYSINSQITVDTSNSSQTNYDLPRNEFFATKNYVKDSSDSMKENTDVNPDITYISSPNLPPFNNDIHVSSTPTATTNYFVSSTETPTPNFTTNFRTTEKYYSSTSSLPEISLTTPKITKKNRDNLNKRPERLQAEADRAAVILNYDKSITPEGYAYSFDTSNGIHADESASTLNGVKAKGSYSYIGDDGKLYSVVYTADENGFRPQGEHLPTSPPIPDAILKVIEKVFKDKEAGIFDDGSYDDKKYGHRNYQNDYYQSKIGLLKGVPSFTVRNNSFRNLKNREGIISSTGNIFTQGNQNAHKNPLHINNSYRDSDRKFKNQDYNSSLKFSQVNNSSADNNNPQNNYYFGSGDEMKYISPVDKIEPKYKHFDDDNRRKLIVNEQTLDEIDMFTKGYRENEDDKLDLYTKTGYQYIIPTNKFPSHFSETQALQTEVPVPVNYNVVTSKPISTLYKTRIDGDIQNYDYIDKSIADSEEIDAKGGYNNTIFTNITPKNVDNYVNQPDRAEATDRFPLRTNTGYFYRQSILDETEIPIDQFISADPYLPYMTYKSTILPPSQFGSPMTNNLMDDSKTISEDPESVTKKINIYSTTSPSTAYFTPSTYQDNEDLHRTTYPFYAYTTQPAFTNGINSPNDAASIGNLSIPRTELSTDNPRIGTSYTPDITINYTDDYKDNPSIVKNIGEDFSGPKQPQGFDPITGYYY